MVSSTTQRITRDQLAQLFGGNTRAIRLFETLVQDVSQTLPAAIDEVQLSTLFSLHGADGSKAAATHASMVAMDVQTLLDACRRQAADINTLRGEVELLRTELHDARARLNSAVSRAQADALQAITLSIGV
jgi:hypothetical protein